LFHTVQPTKVNQIHIHWSIALWNLWNIASSPNSPQIPLLPEEGRGFFVKVFLPFLVEKVK
jgi:hypothetical protein